MIELFLLMVVGTVVLLGVLFLKLFLGLIVLPLKILGGLAHGLLWLIIGIPLALVGIVLGLVLIPIGMIVIPLLALLCLPFVLLFFAFGWC